MGDIPYQAMSTPTKRGLRTIGDPVYEGKTMYDNWGTLFPVFGTTWDLFKALLMNPFKNFADIFTLRLLFAMFFVFLGSIAYSLTFVGAQAHAVANSTDTFLTAILIAFVSATTLYVTSLWTYYDDLPTIIVPAHAIGMIATTKIGGVLSAIYGLFIFAGYATSGAILKALGVTGTLQNVAAANADTYWLYWFGASFICFTFVFIRLFSQEIEFSTQTASRSAMGTALATFAMTAAFWQYGLNSYNSGLFVTQSIISGGVEPAAYAGDTVTAWAYFVFVDLLAVPATTWLLVAFIAFLHWMDKSLRSPESSGSQIDYSTGESRSHSSSSAPLVQGQSANGGTRQRGKAPVVVNY